MDTSSVLAQRANQHSATLSNFRQSRVIFHRPTKCLRRGNVTPYPGGSGWRPKRGKVPQADLPGFPGSRGLLDPALRHNTECLGTGGESFMRWLALLFQVIMPGPIGFYLAYAMAL